MKPNTPSFDSERFPGSGASAVETLIRFDEASASDLAAIEANPRHAAALKHLRMADRFLELGGLRRDLDGEPLSEAAPNVSGAELFDFGRGELDQLSAERVERHLADCPDESAWVKDLRESTPPADLTWTPLDAVPAPADAPLPPRAKSLRLRASSPSRKPVPAWVAWTPLAAAALVLAMALSGQGPKNTMEGGLPVSPILRSATAETLLFPRGRVVAPTANVTTYATRPLFEVTPVKGASAYRFELFDVSNRSAFAEGERVWQMDSKVHTVTSAAFTPGSYRWNAVAIVNGLERSLGSMTFTVVPTTAVDAEVLLGATSAGFRHQPARVRKDIRLLHGSGFLTDARERARALPQSEERDRYLAVPSTRTE